MSNQNVSYPPPNELRRGMWANLILIPTGNEPVGRRLYGTVVEHPHGVEFHHYQRVVADTTPGYKVQEAGHHSFFYAHRIDEIRYMAQSKAINCLPITGDQPEFSAITKRWMDRGWTTPQNAEMLKTLWERLDRPAWLTVWLDIPSPDQWNVSVDGDEDYLDEDGVLEKWGRTW